MTILRPDGPQGGKFVAEIEPQQAKDYVEILQKGLIGQALLQALKIAGISVLDGSSV